MQDEPGRNQGHDKPTFSDVGFNIAAIVVNITPTLESYRQLFQKCTDTNGLANGRCWQETANLCSCHHSKELVE
jgi:hypothetical protein